MQRESTVRHEGMLAAYFGIYAIAAFLMGMGWSRAVFVNGYLASALTLCFVAWFSVFKAHPLASDQPNLRQGGTNPNALPQSLQASSAGSPADRWETAHPSPCCAWTAWLEWQ